MPDVLVIDGSYGEGGGQILRTACSLSAITGRAMEIVSIRAGREKPGLRAQHLSAVKAAAELCKADLMGVEVGSTQLQMWPRAPISAGSHRFVIGTAGATALVAQTALLPLATISEPSSLRISGGTHNPMAPTADYLERVYAPLLSRFGVSANVACERPGFYPQGGGELSVTVQGGGQGTGVDLLDRGAVTKVRAVVVTSGLEPHVGQRGESEIRARLAGEPLEVEQQPSAAGISRGAAVTLVAECDNGIAGFSALGERGKPMEAVAGEACAAYLAWKATGAAVDEHLADQLVLPALLSRGTSRWTTPLVTEHLRTVAWLVNHFVPVEVSFKQEANRIVVSLTSGR